MRKWLKTDKLRGKFYNAIVVYLLAVEFSIVPVFFKINTIPITSALIGVGGPLLYFYYKETVKKPLIVKNSDIKYAKFFLNFEKNGLVYYYPVIHAYISLKNVGNVTSKDCIVRVNTNGGGHPGRWGGVNKEKLDIHPGYSHRLLLLRAFPKLDNLKSINQKLKLENKGYRLAPFHYYRALRDAGNGKPIRIGNLDLYLMRIRTMEQEKRILQREDRKSESDVFFGKPMNKLQDSYSIELNITAEDYFRKLKEVGIIKLKDMLYEGEWQPTTKNSEDYDILRNILDDLGWKDK